MPRIEIRRILTPGQFCLARGRHENRNAVTVPTCRRMAKLEIDLLPCCPDCAKTRTRKLTRKASR